MWRTATAFHRVTHRAVSSSEVAIRQLTLSGVVSACHVQNKSAHPGQVCARGTFKVHPFKRQKAALDFATAGFPAGPKAKGVRVSFLSTHTPQEGLCSASHRGGCRSGLSPQPGSPCHVLPAWLFLNSSRRSFATPWNPGPDFSLPFPINTCLCRRKGERWRA